MSRNTQKIKKEELQLDISVITPPLLANQRQTAYLRIGLTGFQTTEKEGSVPLNIVLVIDTSSSMQGEKIRRAKEVAMMIVTQLRPIDTIAIVVYNQQGKVLLPTTKAQDRDMIIGVIHKLFGDEKTTLLNGTALFDGIEKGAREIFNNLQPHQINRMILLSDGLANVGPHLPLEIGEFGRVLGKENIAVTTVSFGVGYNKKLMMQLSQKSDGHHILVKKNTNITRTFKQEFAQMTSVMAQEVNVTLVCSEEVSPIKVLNQKAQIAGQTVSVQLNQLCEKKEKSILVELEILPIPNEQEQALAELAIVYYNLKIRRHRHLNDKITWLIVGY